MQSIAVPLAAVRPNLKRLPRHVGIIPDGNRRWARLRGMAPGEGYREGLVQGLRMLEECRDLGIEEVSVYGFTHENTHRPTEQKRAFTEACVGFAKTVVECGVALSVVGDARSPAFPRELVPFTEQRVGEGLKVNLLVNYGWEWDLRQAVQAGAAQDTKGRPLLDLLGSREVSRIDLVVRWGGCQRLSGFLPVQTVYADYAFVPEYWPDYQPEQFMKTLRWYEKQDVTLGG